MLGRNVWNAPWGFKVRRSSEEMKLILHSAAIDKRYEEHGFLLSSAGCFPVAHAGPNTALAVLGANCREQASYSVAETRHASCVDASEQRLTWLIRSANRCWSNPTGPDIEPFQVGS